MWRGRFFAFCRGAAVFGLVVVSAGVAAGSVVKPGEDEWLARFVAWHQVNEFRALASPRSANLAWFEAPLLRSYLYLFSATGDTFWLERFVFHSDSVLRVMRDVPDSGRFWCGYQDGFKDWGTTVYDPAGFYQEYLVHDAVISLPVVRFARLVYEDKGLWPRFRERADFYRQVVVREVVGKWYANWGARRGEGGELERFGGWRFLPLNQFLAFGELLVVLSEVDSLSGGAGGFGVVPAGFYQAVPDSMARVLWQSLVLDLQNDCWVWGHWPAGGLGQRWADVAHANIDISFALAMQEGGRVFGAGDLARFGRTLLRVVRAEDSAGVFLRRFVNGSGARDSVLLLESWVRLGRFVPGVYGLVAELLRRVEVERINVSMAVTGAALLAALRQGDGEAEVVFEQAGAWWRKDGVAGGGLRGQNGGDGCGQGVAVFDVNGRRVRCEQRPGVYFRFSGGRGVKVVRY